MASEKLTSEEKSLLLKIARESIETAVARELQKPLDLKSMPPALQVIGVSFVTLTKTGMLRGCIGALEPYQPLAEDVREHAAAAALEDYRFPPVRSEEVKELHIEISRLTVPTPLPYDSPEDLLSKLQPGVDGVVLRDGYNRATFLPQVWEQLPGKETFLAHLCQKMGALEDHWRHKKLTVLTYQVEEFHE